MKTLIQHFQDKPVSRETLKRGLLRALSAFLYGASTAFVVIPVNLEDPKKYLIALTIGAISGGLMGLQKLVAGYIKYDLK